MYTFEATTSGSSGGSAVTGLPPLPEFPDGDGHDVPARPASWLEHDGPLPDLSAADYIGVPTEQHANADARRRPLATGSDNLDIAGDERPGVPRDSGRRSVDAAVVRAAFGRRRVPRHILELWYEEPPLQRDHPEPTLADWARADTLEQPAAFAPQTFETPRQLSQRQRIGHAVMRVVDNIAATGFALYLLAGGPMPGPRTHGANNVASIQPTSRDGALPDDTAEEREPSEWTQAYRARLNGQVAHALRLLRGGAFPDTAPNPLQAQFTDEDSQDDASVTLYPAEGRPLYTARRREIDGIEHWIQIVVHNAAFAGVLPDHLKQQGSRESAPLRRIVDDALEQMGQDAHVDQARAFLERDVRERFAHESEFFGGDEWDPRHTAFFGATIPSAREALRAQQGLSLEAFLTIATMSIESLNWDDRELVIPILQRQVRQLARYHVSMTRAERQMAG